ncbi:GRAM domain-containing protein [Xylogone sp. PMI_703]|nr:GRAM domain-containing protein [Xylogone sp. PMI_703]
MGKRRTRGSSAATTTTIGAAITAANASVAHPTATTAPKITGFAVASKKRNRDFHQLFRSVPDDDYLIEDYSCALQREILAHGRLYVSEGHLCFSSNILGWVTTLVMSFDEIVSVEKRSTALVFKNGLMISTLHAKHIFASFTSRDSTYDLIVGIWKLGHPSLHSSLNGVRLDGAGGGDKTEKDDIVANGSQSGSDSEGDSDEEEVYDEDEDEEDGMSINQIDGSTAGSDDIGKSVSRKPSAVAVANGGSPEKSKDASPMDGAQDFPGPATHAPTDCSDKSTHYDKILSDEVIPAPLGKVYTLMFGPASGSFMRQWLSNDQKCTEVSLEETQILTAENKVRTYSYIKPLNAPIGPKSTKCVCTETLEAIDLEKAVSVTISTQTPDVPSGNVFSTKTKYCLTWAEGNGTRLQMNCTIEWTGKSWLKGPIEKGANEGQVQFAKDIIAAIKGAISSRRGPPAAITTAKGKKKGRKGKETKAIAEPEVAVETKPAAAEWGVLQPLKGVLGPVVDIIKPILTANVIYIILVTLLVTSWLRFGFSGKGDHTSVGMHGIGHHISGSERLAAYDELWRREESELWDWLDQRIGMERLRDVGRMPIEAKFVGDKLREEKMDAREVDDAIRVTEERLRLLKDVVRRQKRGQETNADTGV